MRAACSMSAPGQPSLNFRFSQDANLRARLLVLVFRAPRKVDGLCFLFVCQRAVLGHAGGIAI